MATIIEFIIELVITSVPHNVWARVIFFAFIIAITVGAVYLVMK